MIKFKQINDEEVHIMKGEERIGQIFTPSGSGGDTTNAIQVCGFTEAFDLWGCGVFEGTKDIQLLYDDKKMEGRHIKDEHDACVRCFMIPCQCEEKNGCTCNGINISTKYCNCGAEPQGNPFTVKTHNDLKDRLLKKNG